MKNLKKITLIFAVVVCFAVCFFAVEASAKTYGNLTYSVKNNKVTITDCKESASGELEIPAKINGYAVTKIGDYAFYYCSKLTNITIPDGVTYIGDWAFEHCSKLTNITIPDSVTYIGGEAFSDTAYYDNESNWENSVLYISNHIIEVKTNLSGSYKIKSGIKYIPDSAFSSCSGLTNVIIPDSVTKIGNYAFCYCSNLSSITIPDSVTSIGAYAFRKCSNLANIYIPDSVTNIEKHAFACCNSLGRVFITDIDAWCKISFNDIYSNPLLYAKNLYLNGKLLTDITIPNGIEQLNYTFCGCKSLTNVTIPGSVTNIGNDVFYKCTKLASINIPNSVTNIGAEAFSRCTKLASINIPNSVTSIGSGAFYNCSSLLTVTIPNSITSIGWSAFENCSKLTNISVPNSVKSIGDSVFKNCVNLKSITISNGITSLEDYTFWNCERLESIIIPNSVTEINEKTFEYCECLKNIVIGSGINKIENTAFKSCNNINKIAVLNKDFDVTNLIRTLKKGITIYAYDMLDNKERAEEKGMTWVELSDYNCSNGNHCFSFYDSTVTKAATCTTTGVKSVKCLLCSKASTEKIPKTGHTAVTLPARTATAKKSGLTAGSKCKVCGKVLKAQTMTLAQGTGLKASAATVNSITLKWTAVNGAKYYKLEQYNASTKKWVAVKTTTATGYTVSKLDPGTKYKFRVTPLDSTKKIAGKASTVLTASTLLTAPTITLTSTKSKTATVTVTKATGAVSYTIYKSTDNKTWTKVTTTDYNTYNITGLTSGKKIYVKVVGNFASGKVSAAAVKSVTVK